MKYNRNPLYQAVHYALGVSAAAGMALAAGPVFAQDSGSEEDASVLGKLQVTGSRISRVEVEGANPVTTLDRSDIERTGLTDLGQLIQELPSITGSPLSPQTNNGGSGATLVDIRGMGTLRTLVLINGRRTVTSDFGFFPLSNVERVEILKDGASAVYGADAVSGVVNIITRRDFEGAEFEVQLGESLEADGEAGRVLDASFITGGNTERGNFVVGLDYVEVDEVFQGDLDSPIYTDALFVLDPTCANDQGLASIGVICPNSGLPGTATVGSSRVPNGNFVVPSLGRVTLTDGAPGTSPGDYRPFIGSFLASPNDTYNFAPVNYIQTPYERSNFFFQGNYELFDNVNFYGEGYFSNRNSTQLLAPLPYDSRFDPSFDPVNGVAISRDNFYNPFGEDVTEWRRRMLETGGRLFEQERDTFQVVAGLQGTFGATWGWDMSYVYGKQNRTDTDFGQFNGAALAQALGPSFQDADGNIVCGTPASPIGGCVSLNAFGPPGSITQEMLDFLSIPLNDRFETTLQVFNATVTGDIADLPAGPLGAAFGYEFRSEEFTLVPDSAKVADATTGNTGAGTAGDYDVDSFFFEFAVPLLADLPGAELLELSLSGRFDDYSTIGSNETFQGGFRWQPVRSVLVRGTFNEVFREPTVGELFSGQADSFPDAADPCNSNNFGSQSAEGQARCVSQGVPQGGYTQTDTQIRSRVGGNPNLSPEQGDTTTFGIAWSPEFIDGFSATVDFWEVDLDDPITSVAAESILTECIASGNLCENITRLPGGNIDQVVATNVNIGNERAEGIDFSASYSHNTDVGLFKYRWLGTYLKERESLVLAATFDPSGAYLGGGTLDAAGRFEDRNGFTRGVYPEWKHNLDVDWSNGNWGASLSFEYIDSIEECYPDPLGINDCSLLIQERNADTSSLLINETDSVLYVDLVGRYTVPGWGTQITAGLTNVTDEDSPFIHGEFNATTDTDTFRQLGRSWFLNVRHSF